MDYASPKPSGYRHIYLQIRRWKVNITGDALHVGENIFDKVETLLVCPFLHFIIWQYTGYFVKSAQSHIIIIIYITFMTFQENHSFIMPTMISMTYVT